MKEFLGILQAAPLFRSISGEDLEHMLECLHARLRICAPGEVILLAGAPADRVGLLLEGRAQVIREEFSGVRTILTDLEPPDLFAEAFACASDDHAVLPVTVQSIARSSVLLIDYRKVIAACPAACPFHARLIQNMLAVMADKNLMLNRRLAHLSKRTTREKLLSYLADQAAYHGSRCFAIPFSRQELADYLCVERSAMSAVISKLQKEGILAVRKNHFQLHPDRK